MTVARLALNVKVIDRGQVFGLCIWYSRLVNACEAAPTTASLPFWPLPVADQWVRLPAWGFLLVFYRNYSSKLQRSRALGIRHTDVSQHCLVPPTVDGCIYV